MLPKSDAEQEDNEHEGEGVRRAADHHDEHTSPGDLVQQ